jgi:hypothetical protein
MARFLHVDTQGGLIEAKNSQKGSRDNNYPDSVYAKPPAI